MGSPVQPDPTPPLELLLAQQANSAIKAGKDPAAVTEQLHKMLTHLRSNPDFAAQGQAALDHGKDPDAVGQYVASQALAQQGSGTGRSFGNETPTPTETGGLEYMAGSVPFVSKATALANAAIDKAKGAPSFWRDYDQRLESAQAGAKQYQNANPKKAFGLAVAGNLLPAVATMGGSAEAEAGGGLLSKILGGSLSGVRMGGLQGLSEAHSSGTAPKLDDYTDAVGPNALIGGLLGGAGSAAGSAVATAARRARVPELVSGGAQALADRAQPGSAAAKVLGNIANMFGTRGQAVAKLAPRVQEDVESGFTPSDAPQGVPLLPLDKAGPSVRGQAEGIVNNTGPGRGIVSGALAKRGEQMRPDLENAFDQGTGTTAQGGDALLRQLSDEKSNIANVGRINEEAEFPKAPNANPLQAWADLNGGNLENGVAAHEALVKQKNAVAQRVFTAAKEATKGQGVESPTFEAIRKTPAGQIADGFAADQMANRQRTLPTAESPPAGMSAEQFADKNALAAKRGMAPIPGQSRELPDPEYIHYFKQRLAQLARLGVRDGSQGTISTQAQGVLGLFQQVRNELPPIWRAADDATAAQFRLIDANNMGRDLMRTQLNPSGNKALRTSMDAVEHRFSQMNPEEQQAARVGMQSAITDHLRSGNVSPKGLAAQLQEPTSAMARRVALATGDNTAPQRLAASLGLQYQGPAAPPIPAPSAEGKAAGLGLDVLKHGASAPSNAPSRSLTVLDQSAQAMNAPERQGLQKGAAQAVRGKMQASTDNQLPGIFDKTPERSRQVGYAFPDQKAAQDFQSRADFWQRARDLEDQLTGNSRTGVRGAEQAASAESHADRSAVRQLLTAHPRQALGTLINQSETARQRAMREKVDAMIARMMVGNNPNALVDAVTQNRLRQGLGHGTSALLPSILAGGATSNR